MAKPAKTREELIAEANASQQQEPTGTVAGGVDDPEMKSEEPPPPDPPLSPEVEAQRASIILDDSDPKADANYAARVESAEASAKKLQKLLGGYSPTAPNEHIVFGNGAGTFTLGELRALFAGE